MPQNIAGVSWGGMELKRAVLSRRNTAKLCGMKLYLRRATHSQAHDNYRVILKREEGGRV